MLFLLTDHRLLREKAGVLSISTGSGLSAGPRTSGPLLVLLKWKNEDKERANTLDHETFPSKRKFEKVRTKVCVRDAVWVTQRVSNQRLLLEEKLIQGKKAGRKSNV